MKWAKDRDGAYKLLVDPESTLTNKFRFSLGNDANCDPITITGFTTSTSGDVTVNSSSSTSDSVTLQTTGCGDVLIILTLSNGDTRRVIRRYTETTKSQVF